jgi:hypothetical protein
MYTYIQFKKTVLMGMHRKAEVKLSLVHLAASILNRQVGHLSKSYVIIYQLSRQVDLGTTAWSQL